VSDKFTLVTGAAGFIGSKVTERLLERGVKVIALDCFLPNLYSAEVKKARWKNLASKSRGNHLIRLEFDLRTDDFSQLSEFDIDSIINEAAMPGLSSDWSNFAPYYDCNLSALNRLLEFSKTKNLRSFIQASTSSVYGKEAVGSESEGLNPTSPYGVSKLAAEKLLLAYNDWFGTPVKILRYFSVYGPSQRPDMAYSKIISALESGSEFTIYGDGNQRRSNTYLDDIVEATLLADTMAQPRDILNICGDQVISLNEAIAILENLTKKKLNRKFEIGRTGDQKDTAGINLKAKQILGWEAKVSIEKGLELQVDAFITGIKN